MTQAASTRPRSLKTGARVRHRRDDELSNGVITEPDAFYRSITLRGVAMSAQRLVHWPDIDLCTWERTDNLIPEETQ